MSFIYTIILLKMITGNSTVSSVWQLLICTSCIFSDIFQKWQKYLSLHLKKLK